MQEKYLYLALDLFTLSVPLLRSFESRLAYYRSFGPLFLAIALSALVFIPWDAFFTARGIWGFNPRYLIGQHFWGLPIEEILFFVVVPFSCIFIYRVLNYFLPQDPPQWVGQSLAKFLVWFPLGIATLNVQRWYTFTTFLLLGLLMAYHVYLKKTPWLPKFLRAFGLILVPFMLVNGVLTGTGIPQEVVWYNNAHNLGIRLSTIPFEDAFYGMALILLNVSLYEYFLSLRLKVQ